MKRHVWYPLCWLLAAAHLSCTGCAAGSQTSQNAALTATDTTSLNSAGSSNASDADTQTVALSSIATNTMGISPDEDDLTADYSDFDATITLSDSGSAVSGDAAAVSIDGSVITISAGGTYALSGTLSNGQLIITGTEKVKLYFDNVSITCADAPAVICVNEKRTILSLAPGSQNSLSDGTDYNASIIGDQEIDPSAIYAQDKLTINGTGALSVSGNCADGIVCKDDLKLVGGTITVDAIHNGIKGKDSAAIYDDASVTVTAGNDGIKSTETDNPEQGFLQIDGGTIAVTAGGDCLQAETLVRISGGALTLKSSGTAIDDATGEANSAKGIHCTAYIEILGGTVAIDVPEDGIHCGGSCTVADGTLDVTSGEDGIQADGDLIQSGGAITIVTTGEVTSSSDEATGFGEQDDFGGGRDGFGGQNGFHGGFDGAPPDFESADTQADTAALVIQTLTKPDTATNNTTAAETTDSASSKGMKAGGVLTMSGGSCNITSTDHAVHGASDATLCGTILTIRSDNKGISVHGDLEISDGEITVETATEGIESKANMTISGGTIRILAASDDGINTGGTGENHALTFTGGYTYVCADGDGIDSNASLEISGGVVLVCGPTSGADGSIDFETTMTFTGGTLLALSSRGMMEYGETGLLVTTAASAAASDLISVVDENGTVLATLKTPKAVSDIIFGIGDSDAEDFTILTGGTYHGTLDENGFGTGGTISGGTKVSISTSGGMMQGGIGGGTMQGGEMPSGNAPESRIMPDGETPPDMNDMPNGNKPEMGQMPSDSVTDGTST